MKLNLSEYFDETVEKVGAKTAVVDGERRVTFEELGERSRKLSRVIHDTVNGATRRPVAVFLPKSAESILSDIAVIYSGNAYMNLDVKTPAARIGAILQRIQPALIISSTRMMGALESLSDKPPVVLLDTLDLDALTYERGAIDATLSTLIDTDPLCIINTSGSTGTPKGVVLNHRSFLDYTLWAIETTGLREDDIFGSLAPIVFDHSSYELCLLMIRGCTMVILPEAYASFPARLMQYVAEMRITYIFWVPTIMVNIANMDLLNRIPQPTLRMIWFAGEVFPTRQFNYWRQCLPNATFVNLYGPTEITVDCTYYIVDRPLRDDEPIPIGFPRRNTDILILNQENKPAKPGEEGELCVRGTPLAMGYYNNPEKTAQVFVQNPLNTAYPERIYRTGDIVYVNEYGEIVFKGRNDTLIKHMGKRIELGEIEHIVVNMAKLVENGCVLYHHEKKEIVLVYEAPEEKAVAELRKAISAYLPNYMVPSAYVWMEQLPRNTNGKIDRLALRKQVENG